MPWSSSSIAEVGDDDQHVAGDPVLDRQAVGRDRLGVALRRARRARGSSPGRPGSGPRGGRRSARRRRRVAVVGLSSRISSQKRSASCVDGRGRAGRMDVTVNPPGGPRVGTLAVRVPRARRRRLARRRPVSPRTADLLAAPLDERVEPEERLQVVEAGSSRSRNARRWFHFRMCQLSRSIASRSSGDRSSLWRTSSVRSGAMTRNRTIASSCGIRAWRRSSGSPSIAVHSTSNRNASRPRTYQTQSTSARSSTARLTWARYARCSRSSSQSREAPRARAGGPARGARSRRHPEAVAAVGEAARSARRAPGPGAGGRRRSRSRSAVLARLR